MDIIAILLFPTFNDFIEKIDEASAIMANHSEHKYMGQEKLAKWQSFLVGRYHKWTENDAFQLYKEMNNLIWDIDKLRNTKPPK